MLKISLRLIGLFSLNYLVIVLGNNINVYQLFIDLNSIRMNISSIDTQLMLLDDTVQALNNYKNQLNQTILEIQTQISSSEDLNSTQVNEN